MKLFTLEEANALLPQLRRLFAGLKANRAVLQRLASEAKQAQEKATTGGGIQHGQLYATALFQVIEQLETISSLGVEIKDIDRGLCDFPALRDGRIVYLCWLLGEDYIEWWHDLEAGFAGRQPL
ncbi:MAG: DUF2203 domain-containing protein [Acidobacteria bacterium]|nr:DUF2203 domain-containing protein [Acidobacteriota bacterium]